MSGPKKAASPAASKKKAPAPANLIKQYNRAKTAVKGLEENGHYGTYWHDRLKKLQQQLAKYEVSNG